MSIISREGQDVLDTSNTASDVWADSAYRSQEIEEKLGRRGLKNRIHRRANRKLSEAQKAANTTRSKVRARVSFSTLPFAGGARTFRAPAPLNALRQRMFHGLIPGSSRPIPSHDAKVLAGDLLESHRHKPS